MLLPKAHQSVSVVFTFESLKSKQTTPPFIGNIAPQTYDITR